MNTVIQECFSVKRGAVNERPDFEHVKVIIHASRSIEDTRLFTLKDGVNVFLFEEVSLQSRPREKGERTLSHLSIDESAREPENQFYTRSPGSI